MSKISSIKEYVLLHAEWDAQLRQLIGVMEQTGLTASIKWGAPVYSLDGKNVIGLGAFKNHIAIWFFQGIFLKKNKALLVNAQEGKTKALRQIKFGQNDSINNDAIIPYIEEAIANQKAGLELKAKLKSLEIPEELAAILNGNKLLKTAFYDLSPGKQKEYAQYIAEAKKQATRTNRIKKIEPLILQGKGLNDRYRK
ncbi:YdeI/OmpD-associated family protein [Christiangramia sp. OXR-203]|uniref:YdeI/OmpD-associated family protein n=1 Tax=Christiangramia sp. OXR-203 TaxID=3100176 RepID=UPI002AC9BA38|nr:YdeI/OmpD-associated family protein [Christiangramia sp. OXR-203]WPY99350.1 YdeI/OmpD-associated family protein [Christiangramia sp. OXR-203]